MARRAAPGAGSPGALVNGFWAARVPGAVAHDRWHEPGSADGRLRVAGLSGGAVVMTVRGGP